MGDFEQSYPNFCIVAAKIIENSQGTLRDCRFEDSDLPQTSDLCCGDCVASSSLS